MVAPDDLATLFDAPRVPVPARLLRGVVAAGWKARALPADPRLWDALTRLPVMSTERARRELKLGPGRTLLGGTDRAHGLYRGLRADRIRRLTEPALGTRIETGILDWLLARADAQRRARGGRSPRRAA